MRNAVQPSACREAVALALVLSARPVNCSSGSGFGHLRGGLVTTGSEFVRIPGGDHTKIGRGLALSKGDSQGERS
jgi:hypothetical protein